MLPCPSAIEEFVSAVLDGRPSAAPGEHGLAVQLVLDAIYASAATGREVAIAAEADQSLSV
jgi:predicted dehydrogenase